MFIVRLWRFIVGYLEVRLEGPMVEKFINLATGDGIFPWGIRRISGGVNAKIKVSDFRYLRPLARKTGCRVRIRGRYGLPFILHRLKRRKMLVAGAVFFFLALYLLSSYIWFVEVSGVEKLSREQILDTAAGMGLRPGVMRFLVDIPEVESDFLIRYSDIAWIGISISGTRATIEIIEKKLPPPEAQSEQAPGDIIAAADGIIIRIAVLDGAPLVREGDTVRAGQVLIQGFDPAVGPVRADGIVEARVWREATAEVPLRRTYQERTGRTATETIVLKDGQKLFSIGRVEFVHSETEQTRKKLPGWRNLLSPVEIVLIKYYETEEKEENLSMAKAIDLARQKAVESLKTRIPKRAVLIAQREEVLSSPGAAAATVRLVIETREDIGIPQAGSIQPGQD